MIAFVLGVIKEKKIKAKQKKTLKKYNLISKSEERYKWTTKTIENDN